MKKQIAILISLVLLLGAILVIVSLHESKSERKVSFFPFSQDQVTAFQVNNFTLGFLFRNNNGAWEIKRVLNDLAKNVEIKTGTKSSEVDDEFVPADSVKVSEALTFLINLQEATPVSEGRVTPSVFEINKHSLHIILYGIDNQELDRIYIGKQGPEVYSSFIKRAASNQVFLVPYNFRQLFLHPFEEWQPKKNES